MAQPYNHREVEQKWQAVWDNEKPLLPAMIIQNQNIIVL